MPLSPRILERARKKFPHISFLNQMVSDLRMEAEFDGACSFSSLLYLDPIDFSHSIHRLHRAIKPGGLLFLYAYDLHPDWRGMPYGLSLDQWMWSWCYGMEDAKQALEEFGRFKVLEIKDVSTQEQKERQVILWKENRQKQHEKMLNYLPPGTPAPPLDLTKVPENLSYCYALIARREP